MKERVRWIDTARFLGIFAIYLGHFGTDIGAGYYFVFIYHVALFFFLSGCVNNYDKESSIIKYSIKKIKSIMIPMWGFSVLSIIAKVFANIQNMAMLKDMVFIVLKGCIRNSFFAASLWFLSCLFLIEVLFKIIKRLRTKWEMAIACVVLFLAAEFLIDPHPLMEPHWLYNLDSAIYFIIFFAIGYFIYPYLLCLFQLDTTCKKTVFIITGLAAFGYSVLVFMGKDIITPAAESIPLVGIFVPIIRPMIIIWMNLIAAKLLEKIELFNQIGRETLWLCGNEYIIKNIIPYVWKICGGGKMLLTPHLTYIYTFFLLVISVKIIIPFEKKILNKLYEIYRRI